MSQELHYTSVPRGLEPGSRGFCTVACTPQMSGPLTERLEGLSGYQPVYPVHDPAAARNPINFSHLKLTVGSVAVSVLSRVGPAGLDYSGRSNKYAHHVVLEANERPEGGPAWLLSQSGFLQAAWEGEPRILAEGRPVPRVNRPAGIAEAWRVLTDDAGWAGVLAESFLADPKRPVFLIFRPGIDLLPLFDEAIALLPPPRRWDVEFSTYFTTLPRGVNCPWRGVLEGSPEAESALRLPNAVAINLGESPGRAAGRTLVHQARTGERREPPGGDEANSAIRSRSRGSPSAAGRPIPIAGLPPQAPPPGSPIDPELIPEWAGRLPKPDSRSTDGRGPNRRQPGRTWAMVAGIVAICLIGMGGSGFFLVQLLQKADTQGSGDQPHKQPEVASPPTPESPPVAEQSREPSKDQTSKADTQVAGGGPTTKEAPAPLGETPKAGTSGGPRGKPPATVVQGEVKQGDPEMKTAPSAAGLADNPQPEAGNQERDSPSREGSPSQLQDKDIRARADDRTGPATKAVVKAEKNLKADFFRLEEPGPDRQKGQSLNAFKPQDAELQLIGASRGLQAKPEVGADGASKVVVSAIGRNVFSLVENKDPVKLATFEVSIPKGTIDFRWSNDAHIDDRNQLRDCVLAVRSKQTHEARFYILRDEPQLPKSGFRMSEPKRSGGKTIYEVAWYGKTGFQKTKRRTLRIDDCRLLNDEREDAVPLTRRGDGSWHDDLDRVTIKFEGAKLQVELQYDQPTQLSTKIKTMRARIAQLDQAPTQQLKEAERKDFQEEIDRSREELERLKYLEAIHSSLVNFSVVWEVEGKRFEIARTEGLTSRRAPVAGKK